MYVLKAFIAAILIHLVIFFGVTIIVNPIKIAFRPDMTSLGGVLSERDVMFFEQDVEAPSKNWMFNPKLKGPEGRWHWQNYLAVKKEEETKAPFAKKQYKSPVAEFGAELIKDEAPIEGVNLLEIKPHQQLKLYND